MDSEINEAGIDALFADAAKKIVAMDTELRAEFTGRPAREIEPAAEARFSAIGVNLRGSLRDYVQSIEKNESFQINLD